MNNKISPFFNIALSIWATWFFQKWIQRQNSMAYFWDVYQMGDEQLTANESYQGRSFIDPVTHEVSRRDTLSASLRGFAKWPLFLIGFAFVIIVYIICKGLAQNYQDDFKNGKITQAELSDDLLGITILNAILIFICETIYKSLVALVCWFENHRYKQDYESSVIYKDFAFMFLMCYIVLFDYAFSEGDFDLVSDSLIGLVIVKAGLSIAKVFVLPALKHWWGKRQFYKTWTPWKFAAKLQLMTDHQLNYDWKT